MNFPLYIALISVLDVIAVLGARFFVDRKKWYFRFISLAAFAASAYVYIQMLAYEVTAIVNVIYLAFSSIVITLTCFIFLKERIHWMQGLGMILCLLGLALL